MSKNGTNGPWRPEVKCKTVEFVPHMVRHLSHFIRHHCKGVPCVLLIEEPLREADPVTIVICRGSEKVTAITEFCMRGAIRTEKFNLGETPE